MKTLLTIISAVLLFSCNSEKGKTIKGFEKEKPKSASKEKVKFEEIKSNDSSNIRAVHYKNGDLKDSLFIYRSQDLLTSFHYKGMNPEVFYKGGIILIKDKKETLAKDIFTHGSLIFIPMTDYNSRAYLYKYDSSSKKDVLTDGKELVIGSAGKVYVYKDEVNILQSNVEGRFAVNKYKISKHQLLFKKVIQMADDVSDSEFISKIVDTY